MSQLSRFFMKNTFPLALFLACFFCNKALAQSGFLVKFPDDVSVSYCPDLSGSIPVPEILGANCATEISFEDQDNLIPGADYCQKIHRFWTVKNDCWANPDSTFTMVANPNPATDGPTVMADSANLGWFQYVQIIKFVDLVPPTIYSTPAEITFCDSTANDPTQYNFGPQNGGDLPESPVELTVSATDCSIIYCAKYRLDLDLDGNGSTETEKTSMASPGFGFTGQLYRDSATLKTVFPPGFELPYGPHKITWTLNDYCGNETVFTQTFSLKNCLLGSGAAMPTGASVEVFIEPFSNKIHVKTSLGGSEKGQFTAFDLLGRVFGSRPVFFEKGENEQVIELSAMPATGVFFVKIETRSGCFVQKLVRQRG